MKNFIFFFTLPALLGLSAESVSQRIKIDRLVDSTAIWCNGHVELTDGQRVKGLIRYNKITGLLQVENDYVSKSLTPKSVLRFDFYDSLQQKERQFISYGFEDLNARMDSIAQAKGVTPVKMPRQFFEVLMEFPTFAVMHNVGSIRVFSQAGKINLVGVITGVWSNSPVSMPVTVYSQSEMLYIFDKAGKATPLWMAFHRDRDAVVIDGKITMTFAKMTDIVMQRYTEPYFYQIDDWAYENKLSFEKKEDILKMFEYYRSLIRG